MSEMAATPKDEEEDDEDAGGAFELNEWVESPQL
jgi:hypothetical protein